VETTSSHANKNATELPYRCIFAVLTWDSVIIYDTFHPQPIAIAKNMHYSNLVDGSWTADGYTLLVCSTDGYVSIIRFTKTELGDVYQQEQHRPRSTMIRPEIKIHKQASPFSKPLPPCEPGPVTFDQPVAKKKRIAPTWIGGAAIETTKPSKSKDAEAAKKEVVVQASQNNHKRPVEDTTAEAVDNLTIDPIQNKKQKKRVQPTLVVS
jgi:chromatin assembly factor 1 subunit B